jgi:hypothetical protein
MCLFVALLLIGPFSSVLFPLSLSLSLPFFIVASRSVLSFWAHRRSTFATALQSRSTLSSILLLFRRCFIIASLADLECVKICVVFDALITLFRFYYDTIAGIGLARVDSVSSVEIASSLVQLL